MWNSLPRYQLNQWGHADKKIPYWYLNRQSSIKGVLTPEALAALPADWLAILKQGAQETDIEMLFEVIEQIRQHNTVVADVLAQVTNDFEYDEILRVIQEVK